MRTDELRDSVEAGIGSDSTELPPDLSTLVSIVICTYQRPALFAQALKSVLEQKSLEVSAFEVVVVDNDPHNGVRKVVERERAQSACPIQYVPEARQGLSYARNTGIQACRGEFVAFLDDDAQADSRWLDAMMEVYHRYPEAVAVTGKVDPIWEILPPEWFDRHFRQAVCVGDWGERIKELCYPNGWIWGGNCSFRRSVFEQVGMFRTHLGRTGEVLSAGEETDLQCRIEQAGGKIYYTPGAVIHHYVPAHRLTLKYYLKVRYGGGRAHYYLDRTYRGNLYTRRKTAELLLKAPFRAASLLISHLTGNTQRAWARAGLLSFTQGYASQSIVCMLRRQSD